MGEHAKLQRKQLGRSVDSSQTPVMPSTSFSLQPAITTQPASESLSLQQSPDTQPIPEQTTASPQSAFLGHDFSRISIFPKLTVSAPDDPYEQEADRVAEQVMRMPEPMNTGQMVMRSLGEKIDRKCAACEEEEELVQTKSIVQRSSNSPVQAESDLDSRLSSSKGEGSPLPDEVRSFMEPRFGHDFSQVRVHTDSEAVQMNRELGAQAFTNGSNIYYGAGKAPAKDELTGHELTHVVQQNGGAQFQSKSTQDAHSISTANNQHGWVQRYPDHAGEVFLMTLADAVLQQGANEVNEGEKTSTQLINEAFWMAYPEMKGQKIGDVSDPEQQKTYADAWNYIADLYRKVYKPKKKTAQSSSEDTESSLDGPWQDLNDIVNEANNEETEAFNTEVTYLSDDEILDEIFRIEDSVNSPETDPSTKEELLDYQEHLEAELSARDRVKKGLKKFKPNSDEEFTREEVENELVWIEQRLFGAENNPEFLDTLLEYKARLLEGTFQVEYKKSDDNYKEAYKEYLKYKGDLSSFEILPSLAPGGSIYHNSLLIKINEIGFSSIPEFEAFISQFKSDFEPKTQKLAYEALAQYEKRLNEEEQKYQNYGDSDIEEFYNSLNSAREQYQDAQDIVGDFTVPRLGVVTLPEAQELQVRELQEQAATEVSNLADEDQHPLLNNQDFNRSNLALAEQSVLKDIMLNYIKEARESIQDSRENLQQNPKLIYKLDVLLKKSKAIHGIRPDSIYSLIIEDPGEQIKLEEAIVNVILATLSIGLAILSGLTTTPIIAGFAALGSATIGGVEAWKAIEEFERDQDFHKAQLLSRDPSFLWVIIAVVGAALDTAALAASYKGLKVIQDSGAIETFNRTDTILPKDMKLKALDEELKGLQKIEPSIDDQMRDKIVKAADEKYTQRTSNAPSHSVDEIAEAAGARTAIGEVFEEADTLGYGDDIKQFYQQVGGFEPEAGTRLLDEPDLLESLLQNPQAARLLKRCHSDCFPEGLTVEQIERVTKVCQNLGVNPSSSTEKAINQYLYENRNRLDDAIADLEVNPEAALKNYGVTDPRSKFLETLDLIAKKKELGTDPKKGYLEHEGEVGLLMDKDYGPLKRDPTADAEWIAIGGHYRRKTFDLVGIPQGKSHFHSPNLENFLPSVDAHFLKSIDYVVLDTRYMTSAQKNTVMQHIENKWKSQKNRLILLE